MTLYGFGKNLRLNCANDFKDVFDDAQLKVHQPGFLCLAKLTTLPQSRLGLVVAKKKVRRAHERNRVKRLARESFRLFKHYPYALDIVLMPKLGIEQLSNDDLHQQLNASWARLQYLAKKKVVSSTPQS
ncbi:MAG: ribonuclease P protein component [Acinetobacter sp.]|nr:ribonuclease P protein component [Acinetobacter sp.]